MAASSDVLEPTSRFLSSIWFNPHKTCASACWLSLEAQPAQDESEVSLMGSAGMGQRESEATLEIQASLGRREVAPNSFGVKGGRKPLLRRWRDGGNGMPEPEWIRSR